jgi:hypothetical protein
MSRKDCKKENPNQLTENKSTMHLSMTRVHGDITINQFDPNLSQVVYRHPI